MSNIDYEETLKRYNILEKTGTFRLVQTRIESGRKKSREYLFSFTASDFVWSTYINAESDSDGEEGIDDAVAHAIDCLWNGLYLELWELCEGL